MQELVCIRIIRDLHVLAVPNQLLPTVTNAYAAQQHRFCERPCEIKIGARCAIPSASLKPFFMMADRPR